MSREINIPTLWEELNRQQFADVAQILFDAAGNEPAQLTRLRILEVLSGSKFITREMMRAGCPQKLAELTSFVFTVMVNQEIADLLSPALRKMLHWCLPEEIDNKTFKTELAPLGKLLEPKISFNLHIPCNLMPVIVINNENFNGPVFSTDKNGVLKTDVTAGEYLDASEYLRIFEQTGDYIYLANITACFYRKNREKYTTFEAQENAKLFESISPKYLKAVWLMIISWHHYFSYHPMFGILFTKSEEIDPKKISIGSSELIYRLSKEGFGSVSEMSHMHIDDFFAIQVKEIKDIVNQLRGLKKNDVEIARDLKLPLETILKL